MATRKQQLIKLLGEKVYHDLLEVMAEMREVELDKRTLRSIDIPEDFPLSAEKRKEIESLFR